MALHGPFQHDTLVNNDFFRLCKLEPGTRDAELVCTLETILRADAPPYEALSYVWGSPQLEHHIRCNNQTLPITTNLNTALRALRLVDKPRTIWIDQICINQKNWDERSHQVNVMGRIFSGASMVNCWVGDNPSEHVESVADTIRRMARLWDATGLKLSKVDKRKMIEKLGFQKNMFPENETLERLSLPTRESPVWAAFKLMTYQPYFSRVWIVQEMAVANLNFLQLIWGTTIIPGHEFACAILMALECGFMWPDLRTHARFSDFLSVGHLLVHISGTRVFSWSDILDLTRVLQCDVEKDRIFAMMGIVDGTGYNIHADYFKSDAEVYADLASQIISVTKSLGVLSNVKIIDLAEADRPLWAPRWTSRGRQMARFDRGYKATRDTKPMRQGSSNLEHLILQGLEFDTVMAVGPRRQLQSNYIEELIADFNLLSGNEACVTEIYGAPIIRAFTATMIAAPWVDAGIISHHESGSESLEASINYLNKVLPQPVREEQVRSTRLARGAHATQSTENPLLKSVEAEGMFERQLKLHHSTDRNTVSVSPGAVQHNVDLSEQDFSFLPPLIRTKELRRFFITQKGYVGIGPLCLEAHDQVCFLYGGKAPYSIRPTENAGEYLFLGDCYVHGLMDGQALDMRDKGELSERWFCLL